MSPVVNGPQQPTSGRVPSAEWSVRDLIADSLIGEESGYCGPGYGTCGSLSVSSACARDLADTVLGYLREKGYEVVPHVSAPLGAISRAVNEAIGRASVLNPGMGLRDLLIGIGVALDDVINDVEDFDG